MCAYGNSILTTKDPGLYTKLLVCPILRLPVPLLTEKSQRMGFPTCREGKIVKDLPASSLSPISKSFYIPFLASPFSPFPWDQRPPFIAFFALVVFTLPSLFLPLSINEG